jgi:hypothetical protein
MNPLRWSTDGERIPPGDCLFRTETAVLRMALSRAAVSIPERHKAIRHCDEYVRDRPYKGGSRVWRRPINQPFTLRYEPLHLMQLT